MKTIREIIKNESMIERYKMTLRPIGKVVILSIHDGKGSCICVNIGDSKFSVTQTKSVLEINTSGAAIILWKDVTITHTTIFAR